MDQVDSRTDADLIAARFPHRQELLTSGDPMQDHPLFGDRGLIQVYFVEVKTSDCRLNGPWTDPRKANLQRVLNAIGVLPADDVENAAKGLYRSCRHDRRASHFGLWLSATNDLCFRPRSGR